jgi:DHA1 family bicyclomycin/chloramphenicol resistance-like MFS transporter
MYDGPRIGRELSRMAAIMALAPLVAPLIGGGLQTAFGWRSNFVVLLAVGAIAAVMVWFLLPETLRRRAPERVSIASILRSYRRFLGERSFVIHLGVATCCMAGLFSWISTCAFVLQDIYGLSPLAFGVAFGVSSVGYLVGTVIAARFVVGWGADLTMGIGAITMAAGGLLLVLAIAINWHAAIGVIIAIGVYLAGMGLALPQAQAGALLPFPDRAGAASSLLGFVTQTSGAVAGAVLGHALGDTAWPLVIAMVLSGAIAVALWVSTRMAAGRTGP